MVSRDSSLIKILIVDDAEDNRKTLTRLIENYIKKQIFTPKITFQIDTANSKTNAIKNFKENEFDLIFMDKQMPEADLSFDPDQAGGLAVKEIREIEKNENRIASYIIAWSTVINNESEKHEGADTFLKKPATPSSLSEKMKMFEKTRDISSSLTLPSREDLKGAPTSNPVTMKRSKSDEDNSNNSEVKVSEIPVNENNRRP